MAASDRTILQAAEIVLRHVGDQKAREMLQDLCRVRGNSSFEVSILKLSRAVELLPCVEMATVTWDVIGNDVLDSINAMPPEKGEKKRDYLSAAEVRSVVVDHMHRHGDNPEAFKMWEQLTREDQQRVLELAFPRGRYGR